MKTGHHTRETSESPSRASTHEHLFLSEDQQSNERKTWAVIVLTALTMGLEIVSGFLFGSMALLADGWHMASHASALGITAFAYIMARKHKRNPRFTFGTGKIGDLAGYSSALFLLFIAFYMAYESCLRLLHPVSIRFNEAILVAIVGLAVNLVSAFILKDDHYHDHDDAHDDHHHDQDHNLRAAYVHVLADALTSILAILALTFGMFFGWFFLDPLMGIVGAVLISHWAFKLMRQAGSVLLDHSSDNPLLLDIAEALSSFPGLVIEDLHVWRLGPGHSGVILSVRISGSASSPDEIKKSLDHVRGLSHITVEINHDPL